MNHIELRANRWYATLMIPSDVQHIIGKMKFIQSTQTESKAVAIRRAIPLVIGWKSQITKARGQLPNSKDTFWESLRRDYIAAGDKAKEGDEDGEALMLVIDELAEQEATKASNRSQASQLYKSATNQAGPLLAPLVSAWKASLRASRAIDQQTRDVSRMADQLFSLDALEASTVLAYTNNLLATETTAASMKRIGVGCSSFWRYLRRSGVVSLLTPNPFEGPFSIALETAKKGSTNRKAFTADEVCRLYDFTLTKGDVYLARVIALGAFTGARIEEICSLKLINCVDGMFNIVDSKTEAGIRQVPIHPALTSLVDKMAKESKDGYLVPSTAVGKYGFRSNRPSQKFSKIKAEMGFTKSHVFHSIRKTVATQLEQAGVVESIAADILGHEKQTMTFGLYSDGSSMAQKRQAIELVVYGGALGTP